MSEENHYKHLPYLHSVHQTVAVNGYVNKLKAPLRNAVNGNRENLSGMIELIDMLEDTLVFIKQIEPKKKRQYKKKPKEEYDLP